MFHKCANGIARENDPSVEISDRSVHERTPLVSVLMITYNHQRYIAQAIESILSQQVDFPYELIIGEDCSTDRTRELALEYQKKYPHAIRLLISERNVGMHNNFKRVSNAGRGKYVAYLEGDDYWTDPHKLQKQVGILEQHPEYSVCGHWVVNVDEQGLPLRRQLFIEKSCPEIFTTRHALTGTPLHFSSIVYRKLDLFNHPHYSKILKLPMADCSIMLVLLSQGNGFCIKKQMSAYRIHSGGIWTGKLKYQQDFGMIQFRIAALDYVKSYYYPQVFVSVSLSAANLVFYIVYESIRSRSLTSFKGLLNLLADQDKIPYSYMAPLSLLTVLLMPVSLIFSVKRMIGRSLSKQQSNTNDNIAQGNLK